MHQVRWERPPPVDSSSSVTSGVTQDRRALVVLRAICSQLLDQRMGSLKKLWGSGALLAFSTCPFYFWRTLVLDVFMHKHRTPHITSLLLKILRVFDTLSSPIRVSKQDLAARSYDSRYYNYMGGRRSK